MSLSDQSYVNILITTNSNKLGYEKRFQLNLTIKQLCEKLELISGVLCDDMQIVINYDKEKLCQFNCNDSTNDRLQCSLGYFLNNDLLARNKEINVHVNSLSGHSIISEDNSNINERFQLSEEEYAKRNDSVLAWKLRNKLGRFSEKNADNDEAMSVETTIDKENIGKRCKVTVKDMPTRLATIRFIGETQFKPGVCWIGVEYDEPLGKNDGSINGQRYFHCQPKYGGFVSVKDIEIGDFPKEDYDLDEL